MATLDGAAAWPAVHDAVTNIRLPLVEELEDTAWLTHTSYHGAIHHRFETNAGGEALDYERLEHVGDALLGAEVALLVHKLFPRLVIGVRTLVKAALVSNQTLALTSSRLDFPSRLRAPTAQSFQLRNNPIVQTSMLVAYLAALYIEKGHSAFEGFVTAIYAQLVPVAVQALRSERPLTNSPEAIGPVNYVGMLMEWAQRSRRPNARTITFGPSSRIGRHHEPLWSLTCKVQESKASGEVGVYEYCGMGSTVAEAKRDAPFSLASSSGWPE